MRSIVNNESQIVTADPNLDDLTMKVSLSGQCNYQLRQVIAHVLNDVPGTRPLLRILEKVVTKLENIDNAFRKTRIFSGRMNSGTGPAEAALSFDTGFGYTSEFTELGSADHYRQQLEQGDWDNQKTESHDLYAAVIPLLERYINAGAIKEALNFGVSYGYVDSQVARRCTDTRFVGIDRSPLTKAYNERYFEQANLEFVAANVFDYLASRAWADALCFHIRTLVCLPEAFVAEFYAKCAKAGFKYIVGAEQCGLSWQTGKPYVFSYNSQPSVVFRDFMFIHNYPGLLKNAGYQMREARLLKTKHPNPNFRLLMFAAELVAP